MIPHVVEKLIAERTSHRLSAWLIYFQLPTHMCGRLRSALLLTRTAGRVGNEVR